MKLYLKTARPRLLVALGCLSLVIIAGWMFNHYMQVAFWRVHPDEQHIADCIKTLEGAYHADRKNKFHITGVWLQDTGATDKDIELVLQLPYLENLDFSNTRVTDASLESICSHKSIKSLRVSGSDLSLNALKAALNNSGDRITLDEGRIFLDK